jgi:hypothetical protein
MHSVFVAWRCCLLVKERLPRVRTRELLTFFGDVFYPPFFLVVDVQIYSKGHAHKTHKTLRLAMGIIAEEQQQNKRNTTPLESHSTAHSLILAQRR